MTTHLLARAAQAGALLAVTGGILAVTAAPALADPPGVQIASVSSTDLPSGGRTTMTYSITNTSQGGGPNQIRVQVLGMSCSGDCTPLIQIAPGETSQAFNVQLTAPQIAAGQVKTVQVQVVAQQGKDTGQATRAITVRGPDKPTTVRQVTGRVKDQSGKPMAGATVGIRDSQGHNYTTTTNDDGRFQFTSTDQQPILAGQLSVGAVKQGFTPVTVSVQGAAGRVVNVPLTLQGGPVTPSALPSASVTISAPAIDPTADPATAAAASAAATNAAANQSGSGSLLFIILGALLVAAGIGAIVLVLMRRKGSGDDQDGYPGGGATMGGGAVVPPTRGAYHDATRVAAPVGGGTDATMITGMPGGSISDAPTMMHQAIPADDEFPDPYGAPAPAGGYAGPYGAPTPYGAAASGGYDPGPSTQYGGYDAGQPTQYGRPPVEDPYAAYGASNTDYPQRDDEPTGMYRADSDNGYAGYRSAPEPQSYGQAAGGYGQGPEYPGSSEPSAAAYQGGPYSGSAYRQPAEQGGYGSWGPGDGGAAYGSGRDYDGTSADTHSTGPAGAYGGGQGSPHGGYADQGGYPDQDGYADRGGYDQRGAYGYDQGGQGPTSYGDDYRDQGGYGGADQGGYGGADQGGYGDQSQGGYYGGGEPGGGRHGGQSREQPEATRPGQRRPLDWLDD